MDPDATLEIIRKAIHDYQNSTNGDDSIRAAAGLAEAASALDEWLSKGGFFPEAWLENRSL